MIRTLAIVLALSTSFVALSAMDVSAQTTEQTDKSEEDWRKSKKKRDGSDIFEDILNRRSTGQGTNQYPQNPIDSLPEDSRRHLMKERAKVIAESEPGTTPDAPYTPSEAAKTDPDLAEQEKEAWTVIMTDMKGGNSQSGGQGGSGPNKIAVAGQGGGQGNGQSGNQGNGNSRTPSVMRGGSSQSVAEIMAQIKGLKSGRGTTDGNGTSPSQGPFGSGPSGSSGQSPLGQSPSGTTSQGQGPQSQGEQGQDPQGQGGQGGQGQAQAQADAAAKVAAEAQSQADAAAQAASEAKAEAQAKADAKSQAKADMAAEAAAQAQAKADDAAKAAAEAAQANAQAQAEKAEAVAQAEAATHAQAKQAPEPIGPLDRIKKERASNTSGSQTSAADYMKKVKGKN